jgi:hypothetical protein
MGVTKLKQLLRAAQEDLPITVRHERWMSSNPNPIYSDKALEFAQQALQRNVGGSRKRARLFRASGMARCPRSRMFTYLGMPKRLDIDSQLAGIFSMGEFIHLRWQMAGITEGWLVSPEVPVESPEIMLGGTMDGVLYDNSGFELKSINSNGYRRVMDFGPKEEHLLQVHAYMIMRKEVSDRFSIVYENKDTSEWREFRVTYDQVIAQKAMNEIESLISNYTSNTLPPMLSSCETKEGYVWRGCEFRDICPSASWPESTDGGV